MKLIDVYNDYKVEYKEYVIIIESGIFYNVYNQDCSIIYNLLKYKIKYSNNNYLIGFPSSIIKKVTDILIDNKISYIIINKDENNNYFILEKNKSKHNNYNKYEIDYNRLSYLNSRICNINNKLLENIFSNDIESLNRNILIRKISDMCENK